MILKRLVAFTLTLSIVFSIAYIPTSYTSKISAQAVNVTAADVPRLVERIVDGVAMALAQTMIDSIVRSTINWANSGFDGNPVYVTNHEQYFKDIADGVVGDFIVSEELGFLCSPFQAQVRIALRNEYLQPYQFQCTLTDVVENIEGFYQDFNQGGWDAWFVMTQNNANNPYGAYIEAKLELDSRLTQKLKLKEDQLSWSSGFLNHEECLEYGGDSTLTEFSSEEEERANNEATHTCLRSRTVTPGVTIKSQLDKVLPSGLDKLIAADSIDQLVSSFANGLLSRYVFGPRGLFARGKGTGSGVDTSSDVTIRTGMLDIDRDGLPDGQDLDQDGRLATPADICFHGGNPPNCLLSASTPNSPYFTPLCQATTKSLTVLAGFTEFVEANQGQVKPNGVDFHDRSDTRVWGNRAMEVNSTIDEVLSSIQAYHAPQLDKYEIGTNKFAFFIEALVSSLLGDGYDLDMQKGFGEGPAGSSFRGKLSGVRAYLSENVAYFQNLKNAFGNCSNPNFAAIRNIEPPTSFFGYCATPEDVDAFLAQNPDGDLNVAFPCEETIIPLDSILVEAEPSQTQSPPQTSSDTGEGSQSGGGTSGSGSGNSGSGSGGSGANVGSTVVYTPVEDNGGSTKVGGNGGTVIDEGEFGTFPLNTYDPNSIGRDDPAQSGVVDGEKEKRNIVVWVGTGFLLLLILAILLILWQKKRKGDRGGYNSY